MTEHSTRKQRKERTREALDITDLIIKKYNQKS